MPLSVGTRTSPKYSVRFAFRTRSSSVSLALFSCPEYVWTMYHFLSPAGADDAPSPWGASSAEDASTPLGSPTFVPPALAIDELREVRPREVEHAENDRRHDRHDNDDDGRGADLLRGRPRDLLELAGHLVREVVDVIVTIERHADDDGAHGRDQ